MDDDSLDRLNDRLSGVLLGMAVGDALGLPAEGISVRRAARLFPGPPRHRFFLKWGMTSDDTEHACMTAQALLYAGGDVDSFRRSLAWRLRWWLVGLPAGVGFATSRSILKLWLGIPPTRSGVWSAGNGPAMRAPVIGAYFASDHDRLRRFIEASTVITHRDPRAIRGSRLIALAASIAVRSNGKGIDAERVIADAMDVAGDDVELLRLLAQLQEHLAQSRTPSEFARSLGLRDGVSGYIYHSVPVCLFCWLRSPTDFRTAVSSIIALGGDTDTTAAIVGALVGATAGASAIPADWIAGVMEYPRSVTCMSRLAICLGRSLAGFHDVKPLSLNWIAIIPRNIFFLVVVLVHGLRRLLPPY